VFAARREPVGVNLKTHSGISFTGALIFACALCLLCAQGAQLRVATWNVRNYNTCDRVVGGVFRRDYPKPETEKAALRAVLHEINADIIVFQEMGGPLFLEELRRDLKRDGLNYPHANSVQGADPARMLAILSRVPIVEFKAHAPLRAESGKTVARGLLEAVFETQGTRWHLFALHLKSRVNAQKGDPKAQYQRHGEALALNKIVQACPADYVVAGDFNDNARSTTLRVFIGDDKQPGHCRPLDARDNRGEIWTHFFAGGERYERFDFLLCSPAMHTRARSQAHIADSPLVLKASDHRPVWADFLF